MSTIVGNNFPSGIFLIKDSEGIKEVKTDDYFKSNKVVLFALPGAFTPTCSAKHLPGYIKYYQDIKDKGVDIIACMAVNDPHVMRAWALANEVEGKIEMLNEDGSVKGYLTSGDVVYIEKLEAQAGNVIEDTSLIYTLIK